MQLYCSIVFNILQRIRLRATFEKLPGASKYLGPAQVFVIHNYKRQYGISFRSTCYLRFLSAVRCFDFVSLSFPGVFCRPKATRIPYFRGGPGK